MNENTVIHENTAKDRIILVDLFDRQIGLEEKMKAHEKPTLHRAFSIFLYHDDKFLLQRRALHKYHSGGLWANTCCSHPREGEELLEAAGRRLEEEAGISCPVREIGSFIYSYRFSDTLYEYEYDHILIGDYEGEVYPNPEEIDKVAWISREQLAHDLVSRPREFAPWFLTAFPMVLRALPQENLL